MKTDEIFLQKLLNEKIPITKHIGLNVEKFLEDELRISAPLLNNKNDKNTAFAGSLFSVAALSGWGFLTLKFLKAEIDAVVVIYETTVLFQKPVLEDFTAVCRPLNLHDWEKFKNRVVKKKNGKISLEINVYGNNNENESKVKIKADYFAWIE